MPFPLQGANLQPSEETATDLQPETTYQNINRIIKVGKYL